MYIPELILEHAHHIRNLDVDARLVQVDIEPYRKIFREFDWPGRHPDELPDIDSIFEGLRVNEISSRDLPDVMPTPDLDNEEVQDEHWRALEKLFVLVLRG